MDHSVWPAKEPQNILIRMPNWLGDLVMATPIIHDIRRKWPDANITAMCQANVGALLSFDPNLNEVWQFKKPSGWIHRSHHFEIIDTLKRGEYDLGILLTNSFSSAWWFWRGKVTNRIGFAANMRSFLLNKAVPYPENKESQHLVLTYKSLLEPIGIPLSNTPPKLYISHEEKQGALQILELNGYNPDENILIGINPGAAYGTAKCWLPERFQAVTEKLLQDPKVIVAYFGDPSGAPLINDICKKFHSRVINFAGKTTIRELMALIESCDVMLTNDSGPMHIAAALNVPLVALFGSTSDVKTGPYGGGTVIHKRVECSPCYKRVCPIDFRCMKQIEVDEVYEEIRKQIPSKAP
ncbi:MAG TPA: lipopolysaccharide heptosyltransferase II [Parachlamydiaceae bacterium]|nr:lipopolysaccharide heptosyltransferase II [Parachlamydiaceae bacterium]